METLQDEEQWRAWRPEAGKGLLCSRKRGRPLGLEHSGGAPAQYKNGGTDKSLIIAHPLASEEFGLYSVETNTSKTLKRRVMRFGLHI